MQGEIDSQETLLPIQILGVNDNGLEPGNSGMADGRILPWLQPASGDDIWTLWGIEYRDVLILGPGNEHLDTFNLTVSNLSDPANYDALRDKLLEAAGE